MATTLTAAPARAGEGSVPLASLSRGDRVRLTPAGGGKTIRGTIEEAAADAIVLRPGDAVDSPLRFSPTQMEKIEVAHGRRSRWREGALIGFVPGAAFFGYAGWVLACDEMGPCNGSGAALALGLMGGAATGAIGALVGLAIKTDRWVLVEEGRPKVAFALVPQKHGFRAGVSVRF